MVRRTTAITRFRGHGPAASLAAIAAAVSVTGVAAILGAASPSSAASSATTPGAVQQQLTAGRQRVTQLTGTAEVAGRRVHTLGSGITALQHQLAGLQKDLGGRRTRLLDLRAQLEAAQTRLGGLEITKRAAERLLAQQLVGSYEDQRPDIVDVVLESTGFNDLLEQLSFIQRVNQQDTRVTAHVRSARHAVAVEARSLGRLNARAQAVAESALSERNQVARDRLRLVVQQLAAAKTRAAATGALATAQIRVSQLVGQLDKLKASQSVPPTSPAPARSGASANGGTSTRGATSASDPIPFPIPKQDAAPLATWSVGDGVSIAAPADTPEVAVCAGVIVLRGIGGTGPSTPVLRCNTPLDGHGYVYYGFAGPTKLAAIGANVTLGEPIAQVGAGTIANSSGPHLEIGFADGTGAPLGAASATQMLALLRAAYAG